ncbi:MAG: O-antigen ligase family protein [Candidatus Omnitrophica bacterium]|nr:O-antigen ligase family protein [Candidatus Omnitrophota bacterium]
MANELLRFIVQTDFKIEMGKPKNEIIRKSMNVKSEHPVVRWIDYTVMAVLGVFCFLYIQTTGKAFAEKHIQFEWLNFPIFVGEFLLLGCGLLFVVRTLFAGLRVKKWHAALVIYFCFVFVKAFWGYVHYGPLALRDAALFYYSVFGLIAYCCYRPGFFKRWVILVCYGALVLMILGGHFNDWWLMPRFFIGLLLAYKFPDRRIGALMAAGIILFSPYRSFMETSRAIILANFISVAFLCLAIGGVIQGRKRVWYFAGSFAVVVLLAAYMFHYSGNRHAQGIFAFDKLKGFYAETYELIEQRRAAFRREEIASVQIYNPESFTQHPDDPPPAVPETTPEAIASANAAAAAAERSFCPPGMKIGNSIFRILIWKDAQKQLLEEKPLLGFSFGKPFRSENLEIIRWGFNDWARDGWIAMHNSYLNIVYRSGLVGFVIVFVIWGGVAYLAAVFIRLRSIAGLLLCSCLLVPLIAAYFSVTMELPYAAIPIWTLYGLILAYAHRQLEMHKRI